MDYNNNFYFITDLFLNNGSIIANISIFLTFLFLCAVVALLIKGNGRKAHILSNVPTVLVTTGLVGTFLGITIGLLEFDVLSIDKSIPKLLNGLKLAFLTSVLGMVYSLILKTIYIFLPPSKNTNGNEYLELFKSIKNSLVGKKNNYVISEIQKIQEKIQNEEILEKIEIADKNNTKILKELNSSFKEFAEQMTKNNTDSLISAIEQVMKDFNEKINDQLGEDFKKLSGAVENLVTWQKQYKNHVEKIESQFENNSNIISSISDEISNITNKLETYPDLNKSIEETIDQCNHQILEFSKNSASLENIRKTAEDSVDKTIKSLNTYADNTNEAFEKLIKGTEQTVEKSISSLNTYADNTTNTFDNLVNETIDYSSTLKDTFKEISDNAISTQDDLRNSLNLQDKFFEKYREQAQILINDFATKMAEELVEKTESVKNMVNDQITQITNHFDTNSNKMTDSINKFDANFDSIINRADQHFQDRLNELDKSLQEELGRSMNIISTKVASLTEKFVDDWTIIVTKSRELLTK